MSTTIDITSLIKFAADEVAARRLQEGAKIRISTGWEGREHLDAKAVVATDPDSGETYILLLQA